MMNKELEFRSRRDYRMMNKYRAGCVTVVKKFQVYLDADDMKRYQEGYANIVDFEEGDCIEIEVEDIEYE